MPYESHTFKANASQTFMAGSEILAQGESVTFADRLNRIMAHLDVDQSELARRLGITSQAVNQWCTGETEPKGKRNKEIAAALDWPFGQILGVEPLSFTGVLSASASPARAPSSLVHIPELDVAASAGPGASDIEESAGHPVLAHWSFPADYLRSNTRTPKSIRIIRVAGDSMEPEYPAGDRVLIDTSQKLPSPPGVYVLWDGFGLVLKRLEVIQGGETPLVRISSSNPAYPPYERPADALAINGRVVGKWTWK